MAIRGTEVRRERRFVAVSRMVGVGLMEKMDVSKDWKDVGRGE